MSGWQPIETAPKKHRDDDEQSHGPLIVLASTSGHLAIGYWGAGIAQGSKGWCNPHDHQIMQYWRAFTHWMPLPDRPTTEEKMAANECPICSAAVFGPAVQGGVSVRKIGDRARRAVEGQPIEVRSAVEVLANLADMLAAEVALAEHGASRAKPGTDRESGKT